MILWYIARFILAALLFLVMASVFMRVLFGLFHLFKKPFRPGW